MIKNDKKAAVILLVGMLVGGCLTSGCADKVSTEGSNETVSTVEELKSEEKTDGIINSDSEVLIPVGQEEAENTETEEKQEENQEETKVIDKTWNNNADISWIDPDKKLVALSFDDGPVAPVNDQSSGMRIQKALSDNGMHATFFYWGISLNDSTKKELEAAYEAGFELGNHTKTHTALTSLTAEEIEKELEPIDKVLSEITGQEKFLIRPPYLACNDFVKETTNVPLISCGLDTKDWDNATTQKIIDTVVNAAEDGSLDGKIVLMHETYTTTAEAVEYLVPYLKDKGYEVVTISELFKMRGREMEAGKLYTQCNKK